MNELLFCELDDQLAEDLYDFHNQLITDLAREINSDITGLLRNDLFFDMYAELNIELNWAIEMTLDGDREISWEEERKSTLLAYNMMVIKIEHNDYNRRYRPPNIL